jgi:ectoine hydroxylase-related dioxygenase (phytanoyl-CoA dioxygenase family)
MTHVRELIEQGYTVLRGAVDAGSVRRAEEVVRSELPRSLSDQKVLGYTQRTFVPELVDDERLLALYHESSLRTLCEPLAAPDGFAPVTRAQVQVRLPVSAGRQPDKPLHVDGVACAHLPEHALNTFTLLVGVLLSTVTKWSGPLEVVPGGHRFMADWLNHHSTEEIPDGEEVPPSLRALGRTPITGQPGDAVVVHHLTPHAAGQNRAPLPRVMVYFRLRHARHDELARRALTDPWIELPALGELAASVG